uniref:3-keto sterol reductase n=1 Tax=Schizophyllum commune (strain H4-8 / FGSC 9210) TaxID=578458 RepID=D8PLY1_SCHCM
MAEKFRPVVLVTGANGGVGFATCQRLIAQLLEDNPSDAHPRSDNPTYSVIDAPAPPYEGLTLIMACRRRKNAEAAREDLLKTLDELVERNPTERARKFREELKVDIVDLDLGSLASVFAVARVLKERYLYISHLVFNAGGASFVRIDYSRVVKQLFTRGLLDLVTHPDFNVENVGETSADGLGWVWQFNVFGHYVLAHLLEPLLSSPLYPDDGRVIWTSSGEGDPRLFNLDDWQLTKTDRSYGSSKYQIQLIAGALDRRALDSQNGKRTRHLVSDPGVCYTKVAAVLTNVVLETFQYWLYYVARFFGSPVHTITAYRASIANVHLALVSLAWLTTWNPLSKATANGTSNDAANGHTDGTASANGGPHDTKSTVAKPPTYRPHVFHAHTDRWGAELVGVSEMQGWEEHAEDVEELMRRLEETFEEARGKFEAY